MFEALDKFLLDKVFEPLSLWIHSVSGIGVYTLAKWFLLFAAVGLCTHAGIHGLLLLQRLLEIVALAVQLVVVSIFATRASGYEERYHKRLSTALPPDTRRPGSGITSLREVTPLMVVVGFISKDETLLLGIVDNVTFISFFFGMYFLSCRPRPPRSKRVNKLKPLTV